MDILVINGPNLNLLGKREPLIYGNTSFEEYFESLKADFVGHSLSYFQSNHEGEIIDKIHEVGFTAGGIVINGGAFSHYSIAIADAIRAIERPVVEVHISNTYAREEFRHNDVLTAACEGMIVGLGMEGYRAAIDWFVRC